MKLKGRCGCWTGFRWWPNPLLNLRAIWHTLTGGICNIVRWAPIVFWDRQWDHAYLLQILEFKLRLMEVAFRTGGMGVSSEKDARNMLIAADLCWRIRTEQAEERAWELIEERGIGFPKGKDIFLSMKGSDAKARLKLCLWAERQVESELKYLTENLNKNLLGWWD